MTRARDKRVCLGAMAGAHGVRGAFKIRTFTEDAASIADYGPLESEDGRHRLTVRLVRVLKPGLALVTAPEITTPEAARALSATKLYVDRAHLPALDEDDAFYIEDLVGLAVETADGAVTGRIKAVHDFGAGDILEIAFDGDDRKSVLVAFTKALVPDVNLARGRVVLADEALAEGSGTPEAGEAATPDDLAALDDPTGELVSPDAATNLDAMRAEDA